MQDTANAKCNSISKHIGDSACQQKERQYKCEVCMAEVVLHLPSLLGSSNLFAWEAKILFF